MSVPARCTAKEAAAHFGVSLRTWHRLEAAGKCPTHRVETGCRKVLYDGAALLAFDAPDQVRTRALAALKHPA